LFIVLAIIELIKASQNWTGYGEDIKLERHQNIDVLYPFGLWDPEDCIIMMIKIFGINWPWAIPGNIHSQPWIAYIFQTPLYLQISNRLNSEIINPTSKTVNGSTI